MLKESVIVYTTNDYDTHVKKYARQGLELKPTATIYGYTISEALDDLVSKDVKYDLYTMAEIHDTKGKSFAITFMWQDIPEMIRNFNKWCSIHIKSIGMKHSGFSVSRDKVSCIVEMCIA